MNFADLFKPAASSAPAKAPEASPAASPNGEGKPESQPNNPAKETENPFDAYKKLFDTAATNSEIQAPSFNLDPKVVADVSSKMDFTQGINPELVQKAQSGDASAMMQMIQEVGRNAYRASLEHSTKLTDTHLGQRSEYESKKLKSGVKEQLTSDALSQTSNLKHPVIQAELNRIARQFAGSPEYADASPVEIANAAKQYLNDLHSALNPQSADGKDSKGNTAPAEIDYMKYITG